MEPNYGATDDEANTPLMEDSPLLTEKPRRGRAVAVAAVIGTTLMAATVSKTGQQKIADLRASLRTPRGTPSVDWVYDLTVTQDQFWQLTCDLSTPGTQPYALCGLTTCSGLEDYPDVAACKCAPETVNEMYEGTPMESTFRMGSSTVYLSQSETYRNAVAAQYAGTLDLPAFCTALTDGTICEESGLGCDFISFHTGATNEECRRKALAKGASHSEAKTHVQTKGDSNAGFAWEIDVVEVCMGAPCYKLEGADADSGPVGRAPLDVNSGLTLPRMSEKTLPGCARSGAASAVHDYEKLRRLVLRDVPLQMSWICIRHLDHMVWFFFLAGSRNIRQTHDT